MFRVRYVPLIHIYISVPDYSCCQCSTKFFLWLLHHDVRFLDSKVLYIHCTNTKLCCQVSPSKIKCTHIWSCPLQFNRRLRAIPSVSNPVQTWSREGGCPTLPTWSSQNAYGLLFYVDVYPSWTDWGLWTECFEGVRTKTHNCFIDKQKVDSTKNYYNFVKCAVETSSESAPCEGYYYVLIIRGLVIQGITQLVWAMFY
jgi:hypothetical protein